MTDRLVDKDLELELGLNKTPLDGIKETAHEWAIGPLKISKNHPTYSVGYSYPLKPDARFAKQGFDIGGRRGWAIVFHSKGTPSMYFTGWVPTAREAEADTWIAFLDDEIRRRHAGLEPGKNPTDPRDGKAAMEHESQMSRSAGAPVSSLFKKNKKK